MEILQYPDLGSKKSAVSRNGSEVLRKKTLDLVKNVQNTSSRLDPCLREKQGLLICEIKGEIQTAIIGIFDKSLPKFRIEF